MMSYQACSYLCGTAHNNVFIALLRSFQSWQLSCILLEQLKGLLLAHPLKLVHNFL